MKGIFGAIPSAKSWLMVMSVILYLGFSIFETVEAAHPWISPGTSSTTSMRRYSTSDPFAVLPASSRTRKQKTKEETESEPTSPKRRSFFSRPTKTSPKESEKVDESETSTETTDEAQNSRKRSSWKEIRKPNKDENNEKKQRRFRFGNKPSKLEKVKSNSTTEDGKTAKDDGPKPKRKSRFQIAREARKERQQEKETTTTDTETKNVTSTADATASNATSTSNSTSTSNFTVISFGDPPKNFVAGKPIIYQHRPYPSRHSGGIVMDGPGGPSSMPPSTALIATAIVSVLGVVSRLWIVLFIANKLASDAEELLPPVQHFVWECLNDKYSKDARIFGKALSHPPMGFTKRQWNRHRHLQIQHQKRLRKQQQQEAALHQADDSVHDKLEGNNSTAIESENPIMSMLGLEAPKFPTQTTIVVDLTPKNEPLNLSYLADIVNLLIQVHASNNHVKDLDRRIAPMETEVVLLLTSPGGGVATYGLAAAQVARLEKAGIRTTLCVDQVAASGGYMIASQTSQIIAAPFAMVGSIGVIQEGLNFNKLLEKYGVKPLVLKAGEHKNPLSTFGPVSDKDLKEETRRMEEVHESFIELCMSGRPSLDPAICDGTVLLASRALKSGLVDRILTSDEYLWERICAGDHVLKLHRTMRTDQRRLFVRALDLLPHLRERIQGMNLQKVLGHLLQGYAFFSMIRNQLWTTR